MLLSFHFQRIHLENCKYNVEVTLTIIFKMSEIKKIKE